MECHDPANVFSLASTIKDVETNQEYDVIIKNTFIDLEERDDAGHSRRACSIPPTWKPGACPGARLQIGGALPSTASAASSTTAASSRGGGASDSGEESCPAEDSPVAIRRTVTGPAGLGARPALASPSPALSSRASLNPEAAVYLPTVISGVAPMDLLQAHNAPFGQAGHGAAVCGLGQPQLLQQQAASGTPLNRQAAAFEPAFFEPGVQGPLVPEEVFNAVAAATASLQSRPNVSAVKVASGPNQVTVVVEVVGTSAQGALVPRETLGVAKDALLSFTANSQNTYILGYAAAPFKDLCETGFRCKIGCVTAAQEATACWDTWQKGVCPRPATCRWCHPEGGDLTTVRVILKKV